MVASMDRVLHTLERGYDRMRSILRYLRRRINVARGKELNLDISVNVPMKRFGSNYSGYWVNTDALDRNSIVYSIGVGEDISFDTELVSWIGCRVYAFDPTPRSGDWILSQNLPERITFLPWGVADFDGVAEFYPPANPRHISHSLVQHSRVRAEGVRAEFRQLGTIMKHFEHNSIDLLKMDIEGGEYAIIKDIIQNNLAVYQLCVEFHHKFSPFNVGDTREAVAALTDFGLHLFCQEGDSYSFIHS